LILIDSTLWVDATLISQADGGVVSPVPSRAPAVGPGGDPLRDGRLGVAVRFRPSRWPVGLRSVVPRILVECER